jgi:hypothetical protein
LNFSYENFLNKETERECNWINSLFTHIYNSYKVYIF